MNKIKIDGVLIVEGKADVSYLSNFVDALFFTTDGYDLNEEKINFLQKAAKVNKLIIYTDPDEAGETIRNRLKNQINPVFEAKSEKIIRKSYKKFGVAELQKEEVIKSLSPYVTSIETTHIDYELSTTISLSDNPSKTKDMIIKKYGLIRGSNKSLENQLNILRVSLEDFKETIRGN